MKNKKSASGYNYIPCFFLLIKAIVRLRRIRHFAILGISLATTQSRILCAWILYFDTTRFFYQEYLKSTDIENTAQPTACGSALLRLFAAVDPLTDSAALKQHRNIS